MIMYSFIESIIKFAQLLPRIGPKTIAKFYVNLFENFKLIKTSIQANI